MYILLIITSLYGGITTHTQEFSSKDNCIKARTVIYNLSMQQRNGYLSAECVEK